MNVVRVLLVSCLLVPSARALEPVPGKVRVKITVRGTRYSYAEYVPRAYTAKRTWPILVCFGPGAEGPQIVRGAAAAAERHGWIVIGSNDSRNGPLLKEAIEAMWADARKRLSIDLRRVGATGISGGSRVASWFAQTHRGAGNIAIAGVYWGRAPLPAIPYYLTCGARDFNRVEMERAHAEHTRRGLPVALKLFDGGHEMAPPNVLAGAMAWLDREVAKRAGKRKDTPPGGDATTAPPPKRPATDPTSPPTSPAVAAAQALEAADALAESGKSLAAHAAYRALRKRWPTSTAAAHAAVRLQVLQTRPEVRQQLQAEARKKRESKAAGRLRLAKSYRKNGLEAKAREILAALVSDYAGTKAAAEAKRLLGE